MAASTFQDKYKKSK
jgi:hypothetical protein